METTRQRAASWKDVFAGCDQCGQRNCAEDYTEGRAAAFVAVLFPTLMEYFQIRGASGFLT